MSTTYDQDVSIAKVLSEVHDERAAQLAKWGPQSHANGTGPDVRCTVAAGDYESLVNWAKSDCDAEHHRGEGTWASILKEEFYEALAESDLAKLRTELIQTAAVAVAWVEDLDSRT